LGMMLAVQYIIGQLNSPLNEFISFSRDWQDARLSYARIEEIYAIENEETQDVNLTKQKIPISAGSIIIDNLSFQYEGPNSPKVLTDVDLIIPEGKITAVVGSSGSGKTTLMKLLLKFYQPIYGQIKIGGTDLKSISSSSWRSECGVVMQDGYIFSDTIVRNIALSDEEFDYDKLIHAVKVANIQEFIETLPLGYNTKIGSKSKGF
jgi:ATP-binding cassette, subfamily B, bacterial